MPDLMLHMRLAARRVLTRAACYGQGPGWSSCRECRAVGVPAGTGDDPYRHRAEHALHAGTHMANSDRVYLVVPQEPCHTGVMGTFGPLVVQRSPGDGELLPVADLFAGHVGDRDPVRSSPARVDLAIICDWHAYPHAGKPPRRSPEVLGASGFPRSRSNQTRQPALRLWPDHAPGRRHDRMRR